MSDIDDCRKSVERLTRDRGEVMLAGDDKISEIRARHAQSEKNYIELEATWKAQVHEDRAWLLAEDARHRAENERLRAALKDINALDPDVPDALAADALRVVVAQMGDLARNALEGKQ